MSRVKLAPSILNADFARLGDLYERFSSRGEADCADKLLSAMRYEFGGHVEKSSR